jgi:hypothetical protein
MIERQETSGIVHFWFYKFKVVGFTPEIAQLSGHTVEYKSEWFKENSPLKLPAYLREETKNNPERYTKKSLLEVLGRKPV